MARRRTKVGTCQLLSATNLAATRATIFAKSVDSAAQTRQHRGSPGKMSKGKSQVRQFAPLAFAPSVCAAQFGRRPLLSPARPSGTGARARRRCGQNDCGSAKSQLSCPGALQLIEHGGSIAGVDRDQPARVAWGADEPDIVVGDCPHGADS
jgi:hypothetical protein